MKNTLPALTLKEVWVACFVLCGSSALAAPADDVKALLDHGKDREAPTDNYGREGSFSASNRVMNFGNRRVINLSPISVNFASNAVMTVNSTYSVPAQSWSMNPGFQNLTGVTIACTPTCPGAAAAAVNAGFTGAQGQGYLLGTQVFNSELKSGLPSANAGGNVSAYAKQ